MTNIEIIGQQAITIVNLCIQVANQGKRIAEAKRHLVCIGGPLNDNKLRFTPPQLALFQTILSELSSN